MTAMKQTTEKKLPTSAGTGLSSDDTSSSLSWSAANNGSGTFSANESLHRRRIGDQSSSNAFAPISTTSDSLKSLPVVQDLTINKLQYDSIGLVGREREVTTLRSCLCRMTLEEQVCRKELIFIKGYSGVGKTSLATSIQHLVGEASGMLVVGKFDLNSNDEPYSGIAKAFGQICQDIKNQSLLSGQQGQRVEEDIASAIVSEVGPDVGILAKLIPELDMILPTSALKYRDVASESYDFEAGKKRWKFAFRVLTRALCSSLSPMVLVLDDLQWADVSSLEVIDLLISDLQNPNSLMIIGCFRSNEVDEAHILTSVTRDLAKRNDKWRYNITDIELGNLESNDVNQVVMSLLSIDDESKTRGLAELCHRRTLGNPFFLIEFVTMLEEEEMISFNLGMLQWMWKEQEIEDATMSTANVIDLLQSRMSKLPEDARLLLQYAACLGSSFSLKALTLLWTKHADSISNDPGALLLLLEGANFIEGSGANLYRWVHDKVKEAALTLGDAGKTSFQFEVGRVMYRYLDEADLEDLLFEVTDLINKVGSANRIEYAELNLRAAEKARSISAFNSAAGYVSKGIGFLPTNKWTKHKLLTLRFYTIGTEMELALARTEAMEEYSKEVLSQNNCSTLEKVPVYIALCYKQTNVDANPSGTSDLCLQVLKKLGLRVWNPLIRPVTSFVSLLRTVKLARKMLREDYEALGVMSDTKQRAIVNLLARLLYASFFSQNVTVLLWSTTRMVEMTLKHGVSEMAGYGLSTLGLLAVGALGDCDAASYFAEMALLIQNKVHSRYAESNTLYTATQFIFPWRNPFLSTLSPLLEGYYSGMRSGNTEMAMWCLTAHSIVVPFQMGRPLHSIVATCAMVVSQCEEFKQEDQAMSVRAYWQLYLNLLGESDDVLALRGEVFDVEDYDLKTPHRKNLPDRIYLNLYVILGEFDRGAKLAIEMGEIYEKELSPGHCLGMQNSFHRGVALFAMARRTKKSKYKRYAYRVGKMIEKWAKQQNPNIQHCHRLLSAEKAALEQKHEAAAESYKEAIVFAARTGHLHDAALSSERFADVCLHDLSDKQEAAYRLEEAIRMYREWGAVAKVDMLRNLLEDVNGREKPTGGC